MSRDAVKSGKQQASDSNKMVFLWINCEINMWMLSFQVSSELFTLTYGALVNDLLNDLESPEEVNRQLDKIGYNM
jgi:hypothetical protein